MNREFRPSNGESAVCVKAEASSLLRQIVTPPYPGESVKSLINRAAHRSGLSVSRATKLWYSETATVLAEEIDKLRRSAGNRGKVHTDGAGTNNDKIRNEIDRVQRLVVEMAAALEELRAKVDGAQGA